ncbi:ATP-dependent nuclease [Daejeonella lutea]|uniref:AAA ATPase domain-containing protein n=1 Tax=Daejeonella lutea TaxID=572036 RepID=A0A1T5CX06_9SPHI|nr:AAA family ATPase [Daejeonella lutea]SKB64035.1 AAA ATPase domain-containing protein [Daejeonella lutea]
MKLINVKIHKYKSFEKEQSFEIKDDVTILVGMNESGKTSVLEAIAKTNYFQDDKKFQFSLTHDYPRREKKNVDKAQADPSAITCTYRLDSSLLKLIDEKVGAGVFTEGLISITTNYNNRNTYSNVNADFKKFIALKTSDLGISSKALNDKLEKITSSKDLDVIIAEYKDDALKANLEKIKPFITNVWKWSNPIEEFIARTILKPNIPKFLYYDEYYSLPSRIVIEKLDNEELEDEEMKTAKALLELADLNASDILKSEDFEDYIAELEATEAIISDELFKYWSTNSNLSIEFKIEAKEEKVKRTIRNDYNNEEVIDINIVEHILDIRVKNQRTRVSLPLKNRSKGFNWFFSFLVWFKKIQEDKDSKYVLLLDEPGLNLHAAAQADLLKFIEDLAQEYQIIYTTHSPFSIPTGNLDRVRTVLETAEGSVITDSIQQKDPNTLFPLQAALGYDIAQNLFIGKKNLLVEGVSDMMYLFSMSNMLEQAGKTPLRDDIVIVPTGGLEKVATFISLMRGNNLDIVCLLDTFTDQKGKTKFENLISQKLIAKSKVRFFDSYLIDYNQADIEDLFHKEDYLKLFNASFTEHKDIKIGELDNAITPIISQINDYLKISRFNHFRPANHLVKSGLTSKDFDKTTINNFENLIIDLNKLF